MGWRYRTNIRAEGNRGRRGRGNGPVKGRVRSTEIEAERISWYKVVTDYKNHDNGEEQDCFGMMVAK